MSPLYLPLRSSFPMRPLSHHCPSTKQLSSIYCFCGISSTISATEPLVTKTTNYEIRKGLVSPQWQFTTHITFIPFLFSFFLPSFFPFFLSSFLSFLLYFCRIYCLFNFFLGLFRRKRRCVDLSCSANSFLWIKNVEFLFQVLTRCRDLCLSNAFVPTFHTCGHSAFLP